MDRQNRTGLASPTPEVSYGQAIAGWIVIFVAGVAGFALGRRTGHTNKS